MQQCVHVCTGLCPHQHPEQTSDSHQSVCTIPSQTEAANSNDLTKCFVQGGLVLARVLLSDYVLIACLKMHNNISDPACCIPVTWSILIWYILPQRSAKW